MVLSSQHKYKESDFGIFFRINVLKETNRNKTVQNSVDLFRINQFSSLV